MKKRLTFIWNTKFQQLTMESLFGRFPYLVEDIFGLLNGKTLSCCSQVNKVWSKNLEEYQLYLAKKIRKHLKTKKFVYGPVANFGEEEGQNPYEIQYKILCFDYWLKRIIGIPAALESNITLEQLPFQFLILLRRFLCDAKQKHSKVNIRIIWVLSILTSCVLRTKKELINEGLVYDIIYNWDTIGKALKEEKHYKEFKTILKPLQNKYVKCDQVTCHNCHQDLAKSNISLIDILSIFIFMIMFVIIYCYICLLMANILHSWTHHL